MNKSIAGSSLVNGKGSNVKNHLNAERKYNLNKISMPQHNAPSKVVEEDDSHMPSPDTRAEIPSSQSRFGPSGGNGHNNNAFDANLSIWNVNEDISFLNGHMNPQELQSHKSNKTASTKPPQSDVSENMSHLAALSGRRSKKQRDEDYFGIPRIPEVIEGASPEDKSPLKRLNKKQNKEQQEWSQINFQADNPATGELENTITFNSKRKCADRVVVRLESRVKGMMDLIIVLLAVYSTFTSTYFAAFGFNYVAFENFTLFVEIIFVVDILMTFFTEYISEEDYFPVRDLKKIGIRYIKSTFIFDVLTVIPFRYAVNGKEAQHLLQLFKLLRLPRLFQLVSPKKFIQLIKSFYDNEVKRVIQNKYTVAEENGEQLTDHNKIMRRIMLGYLFRVVRMIMIIFTLSYFIGTLWYIFCWQMYRKYYSESDANFITKFGFVESMKEQRYFDSMIHVMYFAFTTLATVGYGDLYPVSNTERIIGSIIILFGVVVFSFVMGNFIEMLMEFKIVTAANEDNSNLSKWFGLLARFNKGRPLPKDMRERLETYFAYYWDNDRNYASKSPTDQRFLAELPPNIRVNIYKDFLFNNFMFQFKTYFLLLQDNPLNLKLRSKYYSWDDSQWSSYMMIMMQNLEPRQFAAGDTIYDDMEDVEEIIFVVSGQYTVGYTVNSTEYFALKMGPKTIIGDHSVMFNKRSEFLYRAYFNMDCQAIRKCNYQEVSGAYNLLAQKLKVKAFQRYKDLIRKPILEHKKDTIDQILRINKSDYGYAKVVDMTADDEEQLREEIEENGGEVIAQLRSVRKLEEKVEQLGLMVNSIFLKYDKQMKNLYEQ